MSDNKIKDTLNTQGIVDVECLVPDIAGNARGKCIPASKFLGQNSRMAEVTFTQTICGEWADAPEALVDPTERDMSLVPDESTMRPTPWAKKPTMQCIHDCYDADGKPHALSARNVLKRVLDLYSEQGWQPVIAPEIEFYLVSKNPDPTQEILPTIGRSGRRKSVGQSIGIDAANDYSPFIEDMNRFSDAQGLTLDTLTHEDGAGQLEVNLQHGDALSLADQVFHFKRTAREAALIHNNVHATFMAKPMAEQAGSSMHIHQSVIDQKTGDNIFSNKQGEESELFRYYIGGLQKYTPGIIALYAPYVNSYRRFTKEHPSSPINMDWGYDNRTTAIRIPVSDAKARRIENRFPGIDCNPYLAIAASLACGYLGIKNKIKPSAPSDDTVFENREFTLSRTLEAALRKLPEEQEVINLLGQDFMQLFAIIKETEFENFNQQVTAWEREFLLLNV